MTVMGDVLTVVFGACLLTLWCYMAYWVAMDARQNGSDRWKAHGVATFLFGVVYAPAYYVITQ